MAVTTDPAFLLFAIFGMILGLRFSRLYFQQWHRRSSDPPLVAGTVPFVGVSVYYSKDPSSFLSNIKKKYGDIVTLFMTGQRSTFFLAPSPETESLFTSTTLLPPPTPSPSLLISTPTAAAQHSKAISKLHVSHIGKPREVARRLVPLLRKKVLGWLESEGANEGDGFRWVKGDDFWTTAREWIYNPGLSAVFGPELGSLDTFEGFKKFDDNMHNLKSSNKKLSAVPRTGLSLFSQTVLTCSEFLTAPSDRLVRRNRATDFGAAVGEYLKSKEFKKASSTALELDQLASLFNTVWSSHSHYSAITLWTLLHIFKDPTLFARCRSELDAAIADAADRVYAIADHANDPARTPLIDACVYEALRLHSTLNVVRKVEETTEVKTGKGEKKIRGGDLVVFAPWVYHHDAQEFEQPNAFVPDRWVEKRRDKNLALRAFGVGSCKCPAQNVAMAMVRASVMTVIDCVEVSIIREGIAESNTKFGFAMCGIDGRVVFKGRPRSSA
ncbi:cytochrome P450 [Cladochytrium replicatum]|nr:cytochrome P450 [Cladochytrium replicatum]